MEDSTLNPDRRSLKIINTVFPYIEDLSIDVKIEFAGSLTKHLNKFKRLQNLEVKLHRYVRFKGPLLKLRSLIILGHDTGYEEKPVRSLLEKVEKYSYLTLRECTIDQKTITVLRYENIKCLRLQNIKGNRDRNLPRKAISFIKHSKLKRLEMVETTPEITLGKWLIKTYLENKFHEDLEEITFSIVDERIDLTNFMNLKKLKKITIYFCIFTDTSIEEIIIPLLIHYPEVKFELREYISTKLHSLNFYTISPEDYYEIRESLLEQFYTLNPEVNISCVKNPFITMDEEDKREANKIQFPFPKIGRQKSRRSMSIDSGSTVSLDEYEERLQEISDSSEED